MDKLVPQKVYLPIDVHKRLPKKDMGYFTYQEDYFIGEKIDQSLGAQIFENGVFEVEDKNYAQPSHWLEKKENQIVLSKDEFRSILAEAQGYAFACGLERMSVRKSKKLSDTYIDNLLQL